jgi:DNA segregation ATPase FtsK/SpoIIIE, S-DNA-T family
MKVDEQYERAVGIMVVQQRASTSFLQRHLGIGYNAAARLMERAEDQGIVARPNYVGKREVLLKPTPPANPRFSTPEAS